MVFVSCDDTSTNPAERANVEGSQNIIQEQRALDAVGKVMIIGEANVYYTQSPQRSLTVEANDNVLQRVITSQSNNVLVVSLDDGFTYSNITVNILISAPNVSVFECDGEANFSSSSDLDLGELDLICNGKANFAFTGYVKSQNIVVNGQANVSNYGLITERTDITMMGQGLLQVYASKELNVFVAGEATIIYDGYPEVISQEISGTGVVLPRN